MNADRLIQEANEVAVLLMEFTRVARDEVAEYAEHIRELNNRIRAAEAYNPSAPYVDVIRDLPSGRRAIEGLLCRLGAINDASATQIAGTKEEF